MDLRANIQDMGRRKPGRPGITDEQAERVREVLRRVREERYNGNASALSVALGLTPSAISQMVSRKNRPSYDTVLLLAELLHVDPQDILAGRATGAQQETADRYPERAAALARLRGMLPPAVEETVRNMFVHGPALTEAEWIRYAMRALGEFERDQALLSRVAPDPGRGRPQ